MKKSTKTTAIAILFLTFFGLAACQEEVIPVNEPMITESTYSPESVESESEDEPHDKGEDVRG